MLQSYDHTRTRLRYNKAQREQLKAQRELRKRITLLAKRREREERIEAERKLSERLAQAIAKLESKPVADCVVIHPVFRPQPIFENVMIELVSAS